MEVVIGGKNPGARGIGQHAKEKKPTAPADAVDVVLLQDRWEYSHQPQHAWIIQCTLSIAVNGGSHLHLFDPCHPLSSPSSPG